MTMKKMMLLAAATLVFAACSNDDENVDNWNGEIRLCSGLTVQQSGTRAVTGIQSEQFDTDEKIDVFISEAVQSGQTATTTYPQPLVYTAGVNGAMNPATQPFFPTSGNGVTIYAVYPSGAYSSGTFTIQPNQEGDDAYKASDLMYGEANEGKVVERTGSSIPLNFNHLLSKVTVKLKAGKGMTDEKLAGAKVVIPGVKTTVPFTASTGTIGTANDGTTADINVFTAASGSLDGSAVIVPQTLSEGFLRITLKDDGTLIGRLDDGQAPVLESGYEYIYTITVNLTELNVTPAIKPWTMSNKNGTATMQ